MQIVHSAIPMHLELECGACGHRQVYVTPTPACSACGHTWMEVRYDYGKVRDLWPTILYKRPPTMWRYRELLPLLDDQYQISMGEGGTPLLHAKNLGMMLNAPNIYIKDERQNPTNSFKDRQASLVISMLKEAGITELVLASTGNVAISYSAYSSHAGIKLWTFLPSLVPPEKMREIAIYGSEVIKVTSNYDVTKKVAERFARHKNIALETGIRNVGTRESMKTIAFELAEQLAEEQGPPRPGVPWRAPDWYLQSVSGGMGPIGVWKGFDELYRMGLVDKVPKLGLIQASGCAPMVRSYWKGLSEAEPVLNPTTRVITIATGQPGMAYTALYHIVRTYGGTFEAVSDEETFRALHMLAKIEGLSMEAAAGATFAGLMRLIAKGIIQRDETVVVNCSGHTFPVEKFLLQGEWMKVVPESAMETPVPTPAAPAAPQDLLSELETLDNRVRRIAIVEDNPEAARLLRRILQTRGDFQILEAHDGRAGLELIRSTRPDMVLLDLMMPDMDGFAVINALKSDPALAEIPVIVITAKELSYEERRRLQGQIQLLLQKGSFMDDELLKDIHALLGDEKKGDEA